MEKPTHDVGVEDILKRFRSKMEKSEMPIYAGTGSIQPNSNNNRVTGGRLIDSEGIAAGIAEADKRKMVWTTKPDMEHYNGIVKSVGTFIGKIFPYGPLNPISLPSSQFDNALVTFPACLKVHSI